MAFYKGEKIRLWAEFRDTATQAPTDPSTPVKVTIKKPDGTTVGDVTATQVDVGVFEYLYSATESGYYQYKFVTSNNAIEQGSFEVKDIF